MIEITGKILAIDVGDVRVGIAISDASGFLASPVTIIKRDSNTIDNIVEHVRRLNVTAVIVGFPLNIDGTTGFQAKKVQRFADRIRAVIDPIPIYMEDERESTVAARELRIERGVGRKKRKARIDAEAAAIFLQAWLDRNRVIRPTIKNELPVPGNDA